MGGGGEGKGSSQGYKGFDLVLFVFYLFFMFTAAIKLLETNIT